MSLTDIVKKQDSYYSYFAVILITAGTLNAILRPIGHSITPYYILSPIVLLYLLLKSKPFRVHLIILLSIFTYGLAAGTVYGLTLQEMLKQIIFYTFAFVAIETVIFWRDTCDDFKLKITRLLDFLAWSAVLICIAQTIFNFDLPSTWGYRQYGYSTAFFYTPNDLALFLCSYLIVALFDRRPIWIKWVTIVAIFSINSMNGSRAGIIVCLLVFSIWSSTGIVKKVSDRPILISFSFLFILLLASISLAYVIDHDDFSFIIETICRIFTNDPFRLPGSVYDRADALIFSLNEMRSAWWMGLGPSGSVHVLAQPEYNAFTAQSLHNAIPELSFDLGPVFYIPFLIWYVFYVFKYLFDKNPAMADIARFSFLISLPFMSIIQSSGFISNYGFWVTATFVWLRCDSAVGTARTY